MGVLFHFSLGWEYAVGSKSPILRVDIKCLLPLREGKDGTTKDTKSTKEKKSSS